MNDQRFQEKKLTIALTHRELCAVCSSLNEVCNGIKIADFEFSSRIGLSRDKANKLLDELLVVYREAYQASHESDLRVERPGAETDEGPNTVGDP